MSNTTKTKTTITTKRAGSGRYNVTDSRGDEYTVTKDGNAWAVSFRDGFPARVNGIEDKPTLKAAQVAIAERDARILADRSARGEPLPPAPVKLTRTEQFNAKRAERIAAGGVNVANITSASVGLSGYGEGECALCDHSIAWLFILHLTTSDKGVVTFEPVGSTCIRTWAEALPLSAGQESILAALALAEDEAAKVKALFREINAAERNGLISEEQASALLQFHSAPARIRASDFLSDVARKALRYGFSERQWSSWSNALQRDLASLNAPCCGDCGKPTRARSGQWGAFYGCTDYPACRWTQNIKWDRPTATKDEDIDKSESHADESAVDAHYDGDDLPF